ncbi:hypothetical protein BJ170DRAFT_721595 [Xylariales sp. AK1849]|nr:hypothetical protein BJ170DRAFT_721595 [Xylariales sp. AK1849]
MPSIVGLRIWEESPIMTKIGSRLPSRRSSQLLYLVMHSFMSKLRGRILRDHENNSAIPAVGFGVCDPPLVLDLPMTAKNGTGVATTGWSAWDNVGGHPAVTYTGLAASTLGETNGERLFARNINNVLHCLAYTNDRGWFYGGRVSPDQDISSLAIASGALSLTTANVTAVLPKDDTNMELATFNWDDSWHICKHSSTSRELHKTSRRRLSILSNVPPTPKRHQQHALHRPKRPNRLCRKRNRHSSSASESLSNWTGTSGSLGFAADKDLTRYIFHISPNRSLSALTSTTSSGTSEPFLPIRHNRRPFGRWPTPPSASLALANNPICYDIRIYNCVNGSLAEIAMTDEDTWCQRKRQRTGPTPQSRPTSTAARNKAVSRPSQRAGIGVGIAVGALALAAALLTFLVVGRCRQQKKNLSTAPATTSDWQWLHCKAAPAEVDTDGQIPCWRP